MVKCRAGQEIPVDVENFGMGKLVITRRGKPERQVFLGFPDFGGLERVTAAIEGCNLCDGSDCRLDMDTVLEKQRNSC